MLVRPWKWGQGHQNLIISFPSLSGVSVQVLSKPTNCSGHRMQTLPIVTVFIVWWPLNLDQCHQNLTIFFNYPNDTKHKVLPESIIWFKRKGAEKLFFGQKLTFKVLVWPWKWGQGHQNLLISFPFFSGVSIQVWSKSTYRVQTRLIFTVFIVWWPWKLGQGHQNITIP